MIVEHQQPAAQEPGAGHQDAAREGRNVAFGEEGEAVGNGADGGGVGPGVADALEHQLRRQGADEGRHADGADEKAVDRGEDKPVKEYDHAMDAVRYFAYTILNKNCNLNTNLTGGI